jgi:aryl-alcohol dehydrogenase-like predicted oxidoreductase
MNLGLGTAQFGSDYGVTNKRGQVSGARVEEILRFAAANGVRVLDTAAVYGASEDILGRALWNGHPFRIVTKIAPGRGVRESFLRSLERLRQDSVYGLLLHRAADLDHAAAEQLLELKRQRLVSRIGLSIYEAAELARCRALLFPDIVQAPLSIADQRLIRDGTLARLRAEAVEIHARSVFLQGLLLVEPARMPPALRPIGEHASSVGVSQLALALGFVAQVPEVDVALVGVTGLDELTEIVRACRAAPPRHDYSQLAVGDENILNPSRWPKSVVDA